MVSGVPVGILDFFHMSKGLCLLYYNKKALGSGS